MLDLLAQQAEIDSKIRVGRIAYLTKKLNSIPVEFINFHRQIPAFFQELISLNLRVYFHRADDLLDLLEVILDIDYQLDAV
jgi:hypothetical protein